MCAWVGVKGLQNVYMSTEMSTKITVVVVVVQASCLEKKHPDTLAQLKWNKTNP